MITNDKSKQEELNDAIQYNDIKKVESLLDSKEIKDNPINSAAIQIAFQMEKNDIVKLLIVKGANPSSHNNNLIQNYSLQGNYDMVEFLLKDSRVNPSVEKNTAILLADEFKYINVFNLLFNQSIVKKTLIKDHPELYNKLIK
jgi:hypothetical protein